MVDKILSMLTIGSTLVKRGMLHRLLLKIAAVLIVAIISAFTLCIFLGFVFYVLYLSLLRVGFSIDSAGGLVALLAFAISLSLGAVAFYKMKTLAEGAYPDLTTLQASSVNIQSIAAAFIDGFLNRKK